MPMTTCFNLTASNRGGEEEGGERGRGGGGILFIDPTLVEVIDMSSVDSWKEGLSTQYATGDETVQYYKLRV